MANSLTLSKLQEAIAGNHAAIRLIVRLQPAGGPGSKVFPPTHSGGVYAWERRRLANGEVVETVLLDSVQSQANRMEQALLEACRAKKLKLPMLRVDFSKEFPDIGVITTLDAPHRIADAIFRDSMLNGKKFRDSDIGQAFVQANIRNATALFQHCPHALIFGVWDSTGSKGGLGNKFQRAVTSEIIGIRAEEGVRTSSRIDPLGITKAAEVFETDDGDWTLDSARAKKTERGDSKKAKPSDFVHGNIPPDFSRYDQKQNKGPLRTMYKEIRDGDVLPGGVTIDHAIQTTVLSFPALRRLRFPLNGKETEEGNAVARTVLAALALTAIAHLREQGYDLRSRCLLIPEGDSPFELIANDGTVEPFSLKSAEADALFAEAVKLATQLLPWQEEPVSLTPEKRLVELVRKSREAKSTE
ncbi:MAG: type I-U CRISPR-associated RAMP protein Csb1/Cas7u [Nitrospirota bacterium]